MVSVYNFQQEFQFRDFLHNGTFTPAQLVLCMHFLSSGSARGAGNTGVIVKESRGGFPILRTCQSPALISIKLTILYQKGLNYDIINKHSLITGL